MKRLLLFICATFCILPSYGQGLDESAFYSEGKLNLKFNHSELGLIPFTIPIEDGRAIFFEVIEQDNCTADELYQKARLALTDVFRSVKDVTQLDDPINKLIVAKGWSRWIKNPNATFMTSYADVRFTLKIECRENRYKVSLYEFCTFASSAYGEVTRDISSCLKFGVKKDGTVRENAYGFSLLAFSDESYAIIDGMREKMTKSLTTNSISNDW